jgi:hypothetical protein
MAFSRLVLPTPLVPITQVTCPRSAFSETPLQDLAAP